MQLLGRFSANFLASRPRRAGGRVTSRKLRIERPLVQKMRALFSDGERLPAGLIGRSRPKTMGPGVDGNILMKLPSSRYRPPRRPGHGDAIPGARTRESLKGGKRRHPTTDFHLPISFHKAAFICQASSGRSLALLLSLQAFGCLSGCLVDESTGVENGCDIGFGAGNGCDESE